MPLAPRPGSECVPPVPRPRQPALPTRRSGSGTRSLFPPSSPLNSQEAGFSRAHPHSAHPLRSRSSSAATLQNSAPLRPRGQLRLARAHLQREPRDARGGDSTRAAHPRLRLGADPELPLLAPSGTCLPSYSQIRCAWRVGDLAFCRSDLHSEAAKWRRVGLRYPVHPWSGVSLRIHLVAGPLVLKSLGTQSPYLILGWSV